MVDAELFDAFVERLREAFFALRTVSAALLAGLDCTPVERGVLQELDRLGPQTVPAMAQARGVSRQALQRTIDRLLAQQWLANQPNPRHQRSSLLELTPAGRRLLADVRARERRLLSAVELPLSDAELRRLTRGLQEMAAFVATRVPDAERAGRGGRS